ncbi:hypothetical protein [Nostoc sp. C110]|uniref:hypothetical protein n=1 Tax=Nostoc sp. C110 TaxID=3349876 RepID=UPI00370DD875
MTRFIDPVTVPKCRSYFYFAIAPHLKNHQRSREQCPKWLSTHNRKNDKKCIQQSICYFCQDADRHAALGILPTSMSLTRNDVGVAHRRHCCNRKSRTILISIKTFIKDTDSTESIKPLHKKYT